MNQVVDTVQNKKTQDSKLFENLKINPPADSTAFLVALHLPSMQRITESLPVVLEDEVAGTENIWVVKGYFKNRLHYLNEKARDVVKRNAAKVGLGWYLTTERGVERIVREIERMKKEEYAKYEKELNAFVFEGIIPKELAERDNVKLYADYTELVKNYLAENEVQIEKIRIVDGISIDVLPLTLDSRLIEKVASDVVKREAIKMLDDLANTFVKDIEEKLNALAKKLKKAKTIIHVKQTREALKKEVESIKQLCEDAGVEIPPSMLRLIDKFENEYSKFVDNVLEERVESTRAKVVTKVLTEENPF